MERLIKCNYLNECIHRMTSKCRLCKNNHARNQPLDFYVKAEDNPIPKECPKLTYDGPAEQTLGYKCPVCGGYTNPYAMRDKLCSECGYKLNV